MLPEESKFILENIKELGCMNEFQIKKLLGKKAKHFDFYMNCLIKNHIKTYSEGVYVDKFAPKFDQDLLHCIWVLLDNECVYETESKLFFHAEEPAKISFLKNNTLYEMVYINQSNITGYTTFLQEKFYKRYPKWQWKENQVEPLMYLFVITDLDLIEAFSDINFSVPHKIAYLDYEKGILEPKIEYFE